MAMEEEEQQKETSACASKNSAVQVEDLSISSQKRCPICLNEVIGPAYLDPCFHKFCFHCIQQWAEMIATHPSLEGKSSFLECPLCRTQTSCIIHNIVLNTFQRSYLYCSNSPSPSKSSFSLSQAQYLRLYVYRHSLSKDMALAISQRDKKRKRQFHISGNRHILPWIKRELQCLLRDNDVDLISQHVVGVLEHFEKRQSFDASVVDSWKNTMAETVRPFLCEDTALFCDELENFVFARLSIDAYDELTEEVVTSHTLEGVKESRVDVCCESLG